MTENERKIFEEDRRVLALAAARDLEARRRRRASWVTWTERRSREKFWLVLLFGLLIGSLIPLAIQVAIMLFNRK